MLSQDSLDVLLVQKFDMEIIDKKGYENVTADYLSRLVNEEEEDFLLVHKSFLDEQLFQVSTSNLP